MYFLHVNLNRICGVMVIVLGPSAINSGFEPWSGQTKDYEIGICCFSAKHAALRRNSNGWLARNRNNMSEWIDMSIRGLLLQWASTIKNPTQRVGPEQRGPHNLFSSWYSWKIAELALNNNHSLYVNLHPIYDKTHHCVLTNHNKR
jgi:hypothetical protein